MATALCLRPGTSRSTLRRRRDFGTDGAWQRDLCAGADRFERGVRAVCAGCDRHERGDGDGIGQGAQIVLNQSGNVITGSIGAITYFTIKINPATGVVTFTDNTANNLWHSNTGNPDDPQTLTLANANLLQLVQTVTDADGDSDTAAINLGTGVFTIQDDGPDAVVVNATAAAIVLDESAGWLRDGRRRPWVCDGDGELLGQLCGGETSAPMVLAARPMRWF